MDLLDTNSPGAQKLFTRVAKLYNGRPGGRPVRWYGRRGGGQRREWVCYVCGRTVDTDCAAFPMTRHVERALEAHGAGHLARR